VGGVLAGGVPLWAASPLVVFPPAVFGGCPPPVPLSRVAASSQSCVSCPTSLASPCLAGLPATNIPCGITNALAKTALAGTSVNDPACRSHPLRLYKGEWIFWKGKAARILCIYSREIGGGTACAQTHHLDPKTGRLLPTDLHATPLITLPAGQPISIRCATWGGGSDEPSELASTSLSTAPHYPNLLYIKSAQTTWLRKATPIHFL